jgi:hypothetical protein
MRAKLQGTNLLEVRTISTSAGVAFFRWRASVRELAKGVMQLNERNF